MAAPKKRQVTPTTTRNLGTSSHVPSTIYVDPNPVIVLAPGEYVQDKIKPLSRINIISASTGAGKTNYYGEVSDWWTSRGPDYKVVFISARTLLAEELSIRFGTAFYKGMSSADLNKQARLSTTIQSFWKLNLRVWGTEKCLWLVDELTQTERAFWGLTMEGKSVSTYIAFEKAFERITFIGCDAHVTIDAHQLIKELSPEGEEVRYQSFNKPVPGKPIHKLYSTKAEIKLAINNDTQRKIDTKGLGSSYACAWKSTTKDIAKNAQNNGANVVCVTTDTPQNLPELHNIGISNDGGAHSSVTATGITIDQPIYANWLIAERRKEGPPNYLDSLQHIARGRNATNGMNSYSENIDYGEGPSIDKIYADFSSDEPKSRGRIINNLVMVHKYIPEGCSRVLATFLWCDKQERRNSGVQFIQATIKKGYRVTDAIKADKDELAASKQTHINVGNENKSEALNTIQSSPNLTLTQLRDWNPIEDSNSLISKKIAAEFKNEVFTFAGQATRKDIALHMASNLKPMVGRIVRYFLASDGKEEADSLNVGHVNDGHYHLVTNTSKIGVLHYQIAEALGVENLESFHAAIRGENVSLSSLSFLEVRLAKTGETLQETDIDKEIYRLLTQDVDISRDAGYKVESASDMYAIYAARKAAGENPRKDNYTLRIASHCIKQIAGLKLARRGDNTNRRYALDPKQMAARASICQLEYNRIMGIANPTPEEIISSLDDPKCQKEVLEEVAVGKAKRNASFARTSATKAGEAREEATKKGEEKMKRIAKRRMEAKKRFQDMTKTENDTTKPSQLIISKSQREAFIKDIMEVCEKHGLTLITDSSPWRDYWISVTSLEKEGIDEVRDAKNAYDLYVEEDQ